MDPRKPVSKEVLLACADALPYHQRVALASRIGQAQRGTEELSTLIKDLRTHPAPELPEIEKDDAVSESLRPQQRDTAQYYHEEQLALFAASAAKDIATLKEELAAPSLMFKKLVVGELARLEGSDDWLVQQILGASSKLKRQLIHACIDRRRVAVLNRVVEELVKDHEANFLVPNMLHGCSSQVVAKVLPDFIRSRRIAWNRMVRFHSAVIVDMMKQELAACEDKKRWNEIWVIWYNRLGTKNAQTLVRETKSDARILALFEAYPPFTTIATTESNSPSKIVREWPAFISNNFAHYLKHMQDEIVSLVIKGTSPDYLGQLRHSPVIFRTPFWESPLLEFRKRMEIIKAIITKSSIKSFWSFSGVDRELLESAAATAVNTMSPKEIVEMIETLKPWIEKVHEGQDTKYSKRLRVMVVELMSTVAARFVTVAFSAMKTHTDRVIGVKHLPIAVMEQKNAEFAAKIDALNTVSLDKMTEHLLQILECLFPVYSATWRGNPPADQSEIELLVNAFVTRTQFPRVVIRLWKLLEKPFLEITNKDLPPKIDSSSSTHARNWSACVQYLEKFALQIMKALHDCVRTGQGGQGREKLNAMLPASYRQFAAEQLAKAHAYFLKFYSKHQVVFIGAMKMLMGLDSTGYGSFNNWLSNPELASNAFNALQYSTLLSLAENDTRGLVAIFEKVPLPALQKHLEKLLEEKKLGKIEKDLLFKFQRVDDPKNRKLFEKTASANNVEDRKFGISAMFWSTYRIGKPAEQLLSLKYLRAKIKNEAMEQRVEAFKALAVSDVEDFTSDQFLPDVPKPQEFFDVYFNLLQDYLEAPDSAEHAGGNASASWSGEEQPKQVDTGVIEGFFNNLISTGYRLALARKNMAYIEFAAELEWRRNTHRSGQSAAASGFRVQVTASPKEIKLASVESLVQWIQALLQQYEKRIEEEVPQWRDDISYWSPLFSKLGRRWVEIPLIVERVFFFLKCLQEEHRDLTIDGLQKVTSWDSNWTVLRSLATAGPGGMYATESTNGKLATALWELIKKSTLISEYWYKLLGYREAVRETSWGKHQAREEFVQELLKITPSAIYLPVVWRFLMNRRQDLLDQFIGQNKSFRGVFFKAADSRKLATKNTPTRAAPVRRAPVRRGAATRGGRGGRVAAASGWAASAEEEAETKMQTAMRKMPEDVVDHRDLFVIEATHGLRRLLPRQSKVLSGQFHRMLYNPDRPVPERVLAAVRYTLQPCVSYSTIVKLIQSEEEKYKTGLAEYKKAVEEGVSGLSEPRPFPTMFMESLIKGVMSNDEPGAPLGYLLTPKFLGSDLARVAVFAVSRVVPFMPPGSLSRTLKMMLTGKRRLALKVTAFKEIIRMLMKEPSKEHLEIIKHEWNRPDLHRDIRVVILTMALHALTLGVAEQEEIAWFILETPVTPDFTKRISNATTRAEILTAILGAKPYGTSGVSVDKRCLQNARLLSHLNSLQKVHVPTEHHDRYSALVLKIAQTTDDQDVRFIALCALVTWQSASEDFLESAELLKFLRDFQHPVYSSDKRSDIERYKLQWRVLTEHLLRFCMITDTLMSVQTPLSFAVDLVKSTAEYLSKLPMQDRKNRAMVLENLTTLTQLIPADRCCDSDSEAYYKQSHEAELFAPLENLLPGWFYSTLLERRVAQCNRSKEYVKVVPLFEELFKYASENAEQADWALGLMKSLISSVSPSHYMDICSYVWTLFGRDLPPKSSIGALTHRVCWTALQGLLHLYIPGYINVDNVIAWIHKSIKFVASGFCPATIEGLPGTIQRYIRDFIVQLCPYDSTTRTRNLTPEAIRLALTVIKPLTTEASRNALPEVERTIMMDAARRLCRDCSDLVVMSAKGDDLEALLHAFLLESLVSVDEGKTCAPCTSLFSSIASRLMETQGFNRLCDFIEKIIGLSLSGTIITSNKEYARVSMQIASTLISSYSTFVTVRPRAFVLFMNWCFATMLLDSSDTALFSTVESVIKSAYGSHQLMTGRNRDQWNPAALLQVLDSLVGAKYISEPHPFSETLLPLSSVRAGYTLMSQRLALQLVKHYGMNFRELTQADTRVEWRVEFVNLLDQLSASTYPSVRVEALKQEIVMPATKNESWPKRA